MNIQEINVYPNIKVSKTICKAQITVLDFQLFKSISFMVRLMDENGVVIEARQLVMDKTNGYNEYGSDDNYVLNWVKGQLTNR